MRRRRVTYRPSKAVGAFGVVWGGIFILIGLFVVVPTFGPFGILWTLAAVAITVMNGYQAFGKHYAGPQIEIEEDPEPQAAPVSQSQEGQQEGQHAPIGPSVQTRLEQLKELREAGLVNAQEYEEKRREILKDL